MVMISTNSGSSQPDDKEKRQSGNARPCLQHSVPGQSAENPFTV